MERHAITVNSASIWFDSISGSAIHGKRVLPSSPCWEWIPFIQWSHQYHQCQGSLTWPLLPLPTRLAFVYITHNLNSVHGHLAFMVSITLFLDCIYLLRVISCQLLFDCIFRSSQFALDADLTVISFERHHQAGARHASRM